VACCGSAIFVLILNGSSRFAEEGAGNKGKTLPFSLNSSAYAFVGSHAEGSSATCVGFLELFCLIHDEGQEKRALMANLGGPNEPPRNFPRGDRGLCRQSAKSSPVASGGVEAGPPARPSLLLPTRLPPPRSLSAPLCPPRLPLVVYLAGVGCSSLLVARSALLRPRSMLSRARAGFFLLLPTYCCPPTLLRAAVRYCQSLKAPSVALVSSCCPFGPGSTLRGPGRPLLSFVGGGACCRRWERHVPPVDPDCSCGLPGAGSPHLACLHRLVIGASPCSCDVRFALPQGF